MVSASAAYIGERWREYPVSSDDYDPMLTDGDAYTHRLKQLERKLFVKSSKFSVLDNYKSLQSEESFTATKLLPQDRIISINQDNSLKPLNVSLEVMLQILYHCHVTPNFLDVLLKFGDQPQVFHESSLCNSLSKSGDGSYNVCYTLVYMEPNGRRAPKDPFSQRQTGVFHRYKPGDKSNFVILLHPMENSRAQQRLESLSERERGNRASQSPLDIHMLVLSSYLNNWRAYIESLADQSKELRQKVLAIDIHRSHSVLNIDTLATLRNLEDKISFRTLGGLKGTIDTIDTLLDLSQRLFKDKCIEDQSFDNCKGTLITYRDRMQSHIGSVEIMEKRIVATIASLSSLLELKNQAINLNNQTTADELNKLMLDLNRTMLDVTRESVDDNTTVKLITIFTLVYLPASFVSSVLGMEIFNFDQDSQRLVMSSDIWIFIVLAVPLTLLTLGFGWYVDNERKKRKRRDKVQKRIEMTHHA
ncbi:hypothetical protein BDV97DRAFT_175555 [Delphinella strobiligena]|nr:hypothetical protein BDV97DRAFT_175555 [Delphinella strobiligena]